MIKISVISLMLFLPLFIQGQNIENEDKWDIDFFHHRKEFRNCDAKVQQADSLVNYDIDQETGEMSPSQVQLYYYDSRGNLTEVYFLNLPGRINFYHQIFEYDMNNHLVKYTNQVWNNNSWADDLINTKNYNADGLIYYEEFLRKNSEGVFTAYQRHFYHYQDNVISDYLRQVKDANGNWYDFSHHFFVYDSMGRLTILYGQYLNNGPVFWERTAIYGENGKISERYLKILRYDPELKMNVLTNTAYQIYSYNIYSNVSEVMNHDWINQQWTHTSTDVYYYSMLKDKKVSVCHDGHTLCISINALYAHLQHGDKIGPCDGDTFTDDQDKRDGGRKPQADKDTHFDLYPNPATDQVTIRFKGDPDEYTDGMILSSGGRAVYTFKVNCNNEITINTGQLQHGTYLIRIYKKEGMDTRTLIRK